MNEEMSIEELRANYNLAHAELGAALGRCADYQNELQATTRLLKTTTQILREKDITATTFMNQVKKLQSELAEWKEICARRDKHIVDNNDEIVALKMELDELRRIVKSPHRAFELEMKIGADTRGELEGLLGEFTDRIRGGSDYVIHGGCGAGGHFEVKQDPDMTREKYFAELEELRERQGT